MTSKEMDVLVNIIGAVESGGQVYGNRRYEAYAPAYANTNNEHTCTLGWAQNYGNEGRKLCQMILAKNTTEFRKADTANIESRLSDDWVAQRWNPNAAEKKALIAIITTKAGKECQDELFKDLMNKYIASALAFDPTMSVQAQMMWCEIEHLGGLTPTKRIFSRASKPFTVDSIITSLNLDQNDRSNNNQVGDSIFWSRHECCAKWIKEKVTNKEASTKVVIIGSARIDENGNIAGGAAGDQTGKEVATQAFYMHELGWMCYRPKSDAVANKMATGMQQACDNDNIGYDQGNRIACTMLNKYGSFKNIAEKCETDCSNLNRAVILYATGVDIGNCNTANMGAAMSATGLFEKAFRVNSVNDVKNGDILVTCSKGHTVVVVSGAPRITIPSTKGLNKNPKKVARATRSDLPVRQYAGKEYPTIEAWPYLNKGNLVDICDTVRSSNNKVWRYVRIAGKHYGFVRNKYLEVV